jgi:hypothetical protein
MEVGFGASGVSGIAAGEGLARLEDGSLTVGFFLLRKRRIRDGKQQIIKKGVQRLL